MFGVQQKGVKVFRFSRHKIYFFCPFCSCDWPHFPIWRTELFLPVISTAT